MQTKPLRQPNLILVCTGGACKDNGAKRVLDRFREEVADGRLGPDVRVQKCACMGRCGKGPAVMTYPNAALYTGVKPKDAEAILEELGVHTPA